jgi:3-hydroxybutyryl-CoA dehydrogenase
MKVDDIRKILVVGTGKMGQMIALQCARCGYEVVAYDAFSKSLEKARVQIPALAAELVAQQKMTPEAAEAALSRISYTSRPEDGADADLLSESVLEDVDLKAKVFGQFHQICQPKTVFTTNTSTSCRTRGPPRKSWSSWRLSRNESSRYRSFSRKSAAATCRTPSSAP